MKDNRDFLEKLREESKQLEIPEGVMPDRMRDKLRSHLEEKLETAWGGEEPVKNVENKEKNRKWMWKTFAAAACVCIIAGVLAAAGITKLSEKNDENMTEEVNDAAVQKEPMLTETAQVTYADVYASMSQVWEEQERQQKEAYRYAVDGEIMVDDAVDMAAAESGAAEDIVMESEESALSNDKSFGETNVQTAGVDEGDVIKNDGRYLYQIIQREDEAGDRKLMIQIVDTKDGLKELSVIEGIESAEEFYVWQDTLVVIENKYLETYQTKELYYDVLYTENSFHQISFFDLTDRSNPEKIKTFTLQGSYQSSRIADGYFYGFSRYYANPGSGEEDYDAYVPNLDGLRMKEDCIVLPEETSGTAYLVLVAIDLNNPTEFTDTAGIVTDSDLFYVSSKNIYVTDSLGLKTDGAKEGWSYNETALFRFAYEEGTFHLEAEGTVLGRLNDSFSMDEYEDHLRIVSTVAEYQQEIYTDDRTGRELGIGISDTRETNALYILDQELQVVGQIEGLAENESIYSARFLGDIGYFVTFRQVDPLFAVDLSNAAEPKVLGELKISGFSEYLHFYSEDRLFGIGMEADEETGRTEGMKLSMFDISDPTNVKEVSKLGLEEYDHSEALYNHRALLISPSANLIGFDTESYGREYEREYLVYAYENDTFVEKLKLDVEEDNYYYHTVRGTFIGERFYLLCGNGAVEAYDLNNGELLESLAP